MFIYTLLNNIVNSTYIRSIYIATFEEDERYYVVADINSVNKSYSKFFASKNKEDCENYIKDLYKKLGKNGSD